MCSTSFATSCGLIRERKRKLSDLSDSDVYHRQGIVPPRFISAKMLEAAPQSYISLYDNPPSFGSLPQELFFSIVGYLGPTSPTLCILAQVTKSHRNMMKTVGDVMLPVAKARFRIPLPPKSACESSTSLFVRHARVAKDVHDNLLVLEETIRKEFPTLETTNDAAQCNADKIVTSCEVDHALDIALCLLGAGHHSNLFRESSFESSYLVARISNNAATTALEWKVSKLCAALGAKSYKYAKVMMCESAEEHIYSACFQVTDEYNEEEDDLSIDSHHSLDEDMNRLDKACMIMQLTIAKDLETARQVKLV